MIAIDYDKQTYNTVATLQAGVTAAQAAYDTAKMASDALTQRLSAFSTELGVAQARLSTAESDQAAADAAEKSVADSLLEALRATRQALIIYASARHTLQLAEAAARQTLKAGYDVSETLSYVTTASAKNSFITRKLLAAAEQADADASAAVSAASIALRDATDAFIATERAAGALFLVVASLVNLQSLMSGYTKPDRSNEAELPSALRDVPPLGLANVPPLPARMSPASVRAFDTFVLQQTPELTKQISAEKNKLLLELPESADLLERTAAYYMETTESNRTKRVKASKAAATLPKDSGLQPGLQRVYETAKGYETEMQDATTLTQKAATAAAQELSRRAARLQTAQSALAAAQQAAGT
jgi:trimeric autotransporter adhesin